MLYTNKLTKINKKIYINKLCKQTGENQTMVNAHKPLIACLTLSVETNFRASTIPCKFSSV